MGNVDKKRTILNAIKRNAMEGNAQITPIHNDDLRFKTWDEVERPESKAVVLAMMDTSEFPWALLKQYCARSFSLLDDEIFTFEIIQDAIWLRVDSDSRTYCQL
ncbi:hypothetical protein LSPH26S_00037 [Lysinibacillus sphaericus]